MATIISLEERRKAKSVKRSAQPNYEHPAVEEFLANALRCLTNIKRGPFGEEYLEAYKEATLADAHISKMYRLRATLSMEQKKHHKENAADCFIEALYYATEAYLFGRLSAVTKFVGCITEMHLLYGDHGDMWIDAKTAASVFKELLPQNYEHVINVWRGGHVHNR